MFTVWRLIVTILCVNLPGYCCLSVNPLKEDGRWGVRKEASQGLLMHADDCTLTTPPQDPSPVWPDLILLGDNGEWVKWGKKMGEKKSITFRLSQRMLLHTVKWLWAKRVPICEWWVFCSSLLQSYLPEWDIKSGHWMQMCCAAKCEKRILGEERPPRILPKICLHTHTKTRNITSFQETRLSYCARTHTHMDRCANANIYRFHTHMHFLPRWWRSVFTSVPYGCQSSSHASSLPHPSRPPAPTGFLQSRRRLVNCLWGLKALDSVNSWHCMLALTISFKKVHCRKLFG